MAGNYVEIKVKATDTAKPDLTDLRAQLDELGTKVEDAKVNVDDADGRATLLDLNARLAAIGAKVANPKLSLSGAARVEAQLAAVDVGLDHLNGKSAGSKERLSALGGAFNDLTLGMSGSFAEMGMFSKVMLGLNVATGLGEPLVAGLTVAIGGLTSGLVAAGAGLGVFGLLATANLTAAGTAATAAQAAQTQYTSSVTAANAAYDRAMKTATTATARKNAETARATALQSAYTAKVQATTAAYANLSPAQEALSRQVGAIQNQWQKFTSSFAGPTSVIVAQLRPLITSVLPDIRKLAMAGETGLSSMLSVLGSKGTGGLDKFVTMLADKAPEAIMRLGIAVGHIATGFGGILKAFMPVSGGMLAGLDKITAKFATWGQTLTGHSGFQPLMSMFKQDTPLLMHDLGQIGQLIKNVVSNMAGMSTFSNSKMLLQGLSLLLPVLNKLAKIPGLIDMVLYFRLAAGTAGKLKTAVTGVGDAFSGVRSGAKAVSNLKKGFSDADAAASDATGAWGTFGGKMSTVFKGAKQGFNNFTSGFGDSEAAASAFSGKMGTLGGKVSSALSSIGSGIAAAASSIGSGVASAASSVASFVSTVVSKLAEAAVATGAWIAEHAVAAASFIAENIAMAASATAAFIAENAATLGLVAGIALLVAGIVYLATHWKQVWGAIKAVIRDAVDFIKAHWKLLPAIFLGPLGIIVTLVLTHFSQIKKIISDALHVVEDVARDVWHWFVDYIMIQVDAVKTVLSWFGRLGGLFRGWWDDAVNAVTTATGKLISFVRGIPGKILAGLADLGGMMLRAGEHAIDELISGLGSGIGKIGSVMGGIASKIAGFIGLSPAREGPLSGGGAMYMRGLHIPQDLGAGIDAGRPALASAANRMAGAVALGPGGVRGYGTAGGGALTLEVTGGGSGLDELFITWLKEKVRVKGGGGQYSVQKALGSTWPRGA
jgi:hypothetical protein